MKSPVGPAGTLCGWGLVLCTVLLLVPTSSFFAMAHVLSGKQLGRTICRDGAGLYGDPSSGFNKSFLRELGLALPCSRHSPGCAGLGLEGLQKRQPLLHTPADSCIAIASIKT